MELKFILETLLFQAQKPLNAEELREILRLAAERSEDPETKAFKKVKSEEIISVLDQLEVDHAAAQRSYRLICVAGAWQFVSQPEYAPWLRAMLGARVRPPRLSQAALETLAIVAYRQPLTRAEIEQIRGVSVDGVMQTLIERGLVEAVGRAEAVGHATTYGTTGAFLEYFGLRNLDDLPAADDLRRIELKKSAPLQTAESNLATAPPAELEASAPAQSSAPDAPVENAGQPVGLEVGETPAPSEGEEAETAATETPQESLAAASNDSADGSAPPNSDRLEPPQ
ncbi:MAG: SMC-Scp complex subunit ScpB [Candidatus Omnitrophica bacterium]|nr:SMC-Scp complex subunit ScpB [Candidatus Omnitrophota bacterium]